LSCCPVSVLFSIQVNCVNCEFSIHIVRYVYLYVLILAFVCLPFGRKNWHVRDIKKSSLIFSELWLGCTCCFIYEIANHSIQIWLWKHSICSELFSWNFLILSYFWLDGLIIISVLWTSESVCVKAFKGDHKKQILKIQKSIETRVNIEFGH
jgi:hypothetical protein